MTEAPGRPMNQRAYRAAVISFALAVAGGVMAAIGYGTGHTERMLGIGLALALCGIGFGLVAWAKYLDLDEHVDSGPCHECDRVDSPRSRGAGLPCAGGPDRTAKISTILTEDAPLSVGLLFDTSGSMKAKMKKAAEAAEAFFRTSNAADEFFLIEFNDRPRLKSNFTSDSGRRAPRQIAHARPTGRTTLIDAVYLAVGQMKRARHMRKALVILSDGGDNWSRHSAREIRAALIESDVQVYAMDCSIPN